MGSEILAENIMLWTLIAMQIAMGGFDVVFHHEITERLAWKPNAAQELRLHAIRNLFYAVLFGGLAWLRPDGLMAIALIAILVTEIAITLWDFVEEDQTRRLPATERVLHTLLAINYGAILAIVMPVAWHWAGEQTGLTSVNYGIGSVILSIAGLGCLGLALRDFTTSRRAGKLAEPAVPQIKDLLGGKKRVLVAGATGFIGNRLVAALVRNGHEVVALVRETSDVSSLPRPITIVTGLEQIPEDVRIDAIVNLAGEPVAGGLWTLKRRRLILKSRVDTACQLRKWVAARCEECRPEVLITASAIGFYGEGGDERLNETNPHGAGFAALTCRTVEHEARKMQSCGVRIVTLRIGLVLSVWGGMLARMVPVFDIGLGGRLGSGRQWMSWIGRDDLVRLIAHALASPGLSGVVNATAPNPVRNADFTRTLASALKRPAFLPVPSFIIRLMLRDMGSELMLFSQRVLPVKATGTGFVFNAPTLAALLANELRHRPTMAVSARAANARPACQQVRGVYGSSDAKVT